MCRHFVIANHLHMRAVRSVRASSAYRDDIGTIHPCEQQAGLAAKGGAAGIGLVAHGSVMRDRGHAKISFFVRLQRRDEAR
jgi:hypothetical protein